MTTPKEEQKLLYALHILRRDDGHISVLESTDYNKVFEEYQKLVKNWTDSATEQKPFSLTSPVVTSFNPGLIYEIKIVPITAQQPSSRYDNPYHQQMVSKGLNNVSPQSPVLDGGYT